MEKEIILTSAYLAPVEYYVKLFAYDKIYVEGEDHYVKQTYRNRCVIASAGGELALTVPTEKEESDKVRMRDIRISDHGNWRHVHWNALVAAYKQSPFLTIMQTNWLIFMSISMNSCLISTGIYANGCAGRWIWKRRCALRRSMCRNGRELMISGN